MLQLPTAKEIVGRSQVGAARVILIEKEARTTMIRKGISMATSFEALGKRLRATESLRLGKYAMSSTLLARHDS